MISAKTERRFLAFEVACYATTIAGLSFLAIRRIIVGSGYFSYTMPIIFFCVALAGIPYLSRYFIYLNPENLLDRTITPKITLANDKKSMIVIGYGACFFMLLLGIIGLMNPSAMEAIVSKLSPISWFR